MHDRDLTSDLLLAEELVDALPAHVGAGAAVDLTDKAGGAGG